MYHYSARVKALHKKYTHYMYKHSFKLEIIVVSHE